MPAAIETLQGMTGAFPLLIALVMGHMLADYPLQGAFLAQTKNRHGKPPDLPGEASPVRGLWVHALTAHALIQGGAVWIITGSFTLGMVEVVLHWLIDFAKCEGWFGYHTDQALHVLCKALYTALIVGGWFVVS